MLYFYYAEVKRIIDGDTIEIDVDLGFKTWRRLRVRLYGVDAPEIRGGTPETKRMGRIVAQRLDTLLYSWGMAGYFRSMGRDKYGRWLGDLWEHQDSPGKSISQWVSEWTEELEKAAREKAGEPDNSSSP